MKKIAANMSLEGEFRLSPLAVKKIAELKGRECYFFHTRAHDAYGNPIAERKQGYIGTDPAEVPEVYWIAFADHQTTELLDQSPNNREDESLIQVIEELGSLANGHQAQLMIRELYGDAKYVIEAAEGMEFVIELEENITAENCLCSE